MRKVIYLAMLLIVACTQPHYPGIDNPNYGGGTTLDRDIISYIDKRLVEEYYWLDEVVQKSNSFNPNLKWSDYLNTTLSLLTTNTDDGYVNGKGQRVFYSYIREVASQTRASVTGFGIGLHYTIATIDSENGYYGFVIENVYPSSPAHEAGVLRGDVITMIGGSYINANNYNSRFLSIENNTATELTLTLRRQTDGQVYDVTLSKGTYHETPVVHSEVIEVDNTKIGYLVYTSFDAEYNEDMINAISELNAAGVTEFILDLRCNRGGSVSSAVKLCSALVPATFEDKVLCHVERNAGNVKLDQSSDFCLEATGQILSLDRLTVICSDYSASASELVIMGLRGLDFPVMLIGSQTEGKNCGMDVTRRTIGDITVEYAPITFMCFNAKGYGDWGEGIVPDIDLKNDLNELGISDKYYPLPRADWGDLNYDTALVAAVAKIMNRSVATRSTHSPQNSISASEIAMPQEIEGVRNYVD
ncbi:MAG: PDZ domain-containing protein [Alistipes sp.]|nr:PDZ domain-containing protein [Alistipes sp.]